MIKSVLKTLKSNIWNYFVGMLKDPAHDKQTRDWAELLNLKLLYGIVFFFVVERVYSWWAVTTLKVLMTPRPLIRSEQFTLSLLIHYPQYLLWGIIIGFLVLLVLNFIVGFWFGLAEFLYRRMEQRASVASEAEKSEVPHE